MSNITASVATTEVTVTVASETVFQDSGDNINAHFDAIDENGQQVRVVFDGEAFSDAAKAERGHLFAITGVYLPTLDDTLLYIAADADFMHRVA